MFEKIRMKVLQKRMNKMVENLSSNYFAFMNALDDVSGLSSDIIEELKENYWTNIDKEIRLMSLENKFNFLYNKVGEVCGMGYVFYFILILLSIGVI